MFSWQRVHAVMLRHILQIMRDYNRMITVFYWPFIDIVLIGYLAVYRYSLEAHDIASTHLLLANIVLWQVVVRANFDVSLNLLEDIWAHNITNMFGSPLTLIEWMVASILFAMSSFLVTLCFYTGLVQMLFGFFLGSIGWYLLLPLLGLFVTGLALGLVSSAFLIYHGNRITSFIFMAGWIFAPLSGVYYDLKVFPDIVQKLAYCFPFAYFFDALRIFMKTGIFPMGTWFMGILLAIVYLVMGTIFFKYMFEKSRKFGLARLTD